MVDDPKAKVMVERNGTGWELRKQPARTMSPISAQIGAIMGSGL
jgi:hypothetical protein